MAQKLEKALRDGEGTVSTALVEFASVMGTQVQAIDKALRDSATAQPEVQTAPFDRKAATAAIARLKRLLEASDGDAEESFRSLQNAVAGVVEQPYLDGKQLHIRKTDTNVTGNDQSLVEDAVENVDQPLRPVGS